MFNIHDYWLMNNDREEVTHAFYKFQIVFFQNVVER